MKKIISLVISLIIVGVGYSVFKQKPVIENQKSATVLDKAEQASLKVVNTNSKIYKNLTYGLQVEYPKEYDLFHTVNYQEGPILDGFYFGPKSNEINGPLWGIQIFDSKKITRIDGIKFEKAGKTFVLFNEGLNTQGFDQFTKNFKLLPL